MCSLLKLTMDPSREQNNKIGLLQQREVKWPWKHSSKGVHACQHCSKLHNLASGDLHRKNDALRPVI